MTLQKIDKILFKAKTLSSLLRIYEEAINNGCSSVEAYEYGFNAMVLYADNLVDDIDDMMEEVKNERISK